MAQGERLAWIKLRHLERKLVFCGQAVHRALCALGWAKTLLATNSAVLTQHCDAVIAELQACTALVRACGSAMTASPCPHIASQQTVLSTG